MELIAHGRAADVYDLGDGTVLRRYRTARHVEHEARLMQWLHDSGYPVPRVDRGEGPDLVMERVEGPTMLADLGRRPWGLLTQARLLADLQHALGELTAPDWLLCSNGVPDGSSVLHLDLHPDNVILSPRGPVVIDWTNASRGPEGYDAAMSYVLLSTSEVSRWDQRLGRILFVRRFARRRGVMIDEHVEAAARKRIVDPNVTGRERKAIQALLDRHRRRHR
ncbi:MAG TPA: aminoglycoside phosphotransferase family protein [Ilumatobacteraceae bacterium]|jgi:aminoglycoside phosphotransferase (APT) family kinase protein